MHRSNFPVLFQTESTDNLTVRIQMCELVPMTLVELTKQHGFHINLPDYYF